MTISRFINFFMILCAAACLKGEPEPTVEKIEKKDRIYLDVIKIRGGPSIGSYWVDMPKITFCKSSKVSPSRARNSVRYWNQLGYNIQNISTGISDRDCLREPVHGEILVKLVTNDIEIGRKLAVTSVYYYRDSKKILYAIIHVIGGYANNSRLLEHEIGHALGWNHYNRDYHIMNPNYSKTGSDNFGLRYISYQQRIINIENK